LQNCEFANLFVQKWRRRRYSNERRNERTNAKAYLVVVVARSFLGTKHEAKGVLASPAVAVAVAAVDVHAAADGRDTAGGFA